MCFRVSATESFQETFQILDYRSSVFGKVHWRSIDVSGWIFRWKGKRFRWFCTMYDWNYEKIRIKLGNGFITPLIDCAKINKHFPNHRNSHRWTSDGLSKIPTGHISVHAWYPNYWRRLCFHWYEPDECLISYMRWFIAEECVGTDVFYIIQWYRGMGSKRFECAYMPEICSCPYIGLRSRKDRE